MGPARPPRVVVIDEADTPAMELFAIQFLQSSLHVSICGKFHNPFISAVFVRICIRDFPGLSHEVFKVLSWFWGNR